jgi:hypothetical protein
MKRLLAIASLFLIAPMLFACSGQPKQNQNSEENNNQSADSIDKTVDTNASASKKANDTIQPEKAPEEAEQNIQTGEQVSNKSVETQEQADPEKAQKQGTSNPAKTAKNSPDSLNFILQGIVKGGARSEVILDKLGIAGDTKALASTTVNKQDRFKFGGKIPRPGLYQLRFPSDRIIVVLEEGIQRIQVDFANLDDYQAKGAGADGTMFMLESFKLLNKYNQKGDSLRQIADTTPNNAKRARIYEKLKKRKKRWKKEKFREIKSLIQKAWDANSVAAPAIAVRAAVQKDMAFFEKMHTDFKDQYPENYFVKKLGEKLENAREYLEKRQ